MAPQLKRNPLGGPSPITGVHMSTPAKSLFVFGIYAVAAGVGLVFVPGLVLGTLGFPPAQDGWVRVVGALAIAVGAYHVVAARNDLVPYIRATVWGRIGFAVILGDRKSVVYGKSVDLGG